MDEKYNLTYWVYLYLDILCYTKFVESYNNFVNKHNMRKLRYQALTMIVKPVIVRDIAIPVWEFYNNLKEFAPEKYNKMLADEEIGKFLEFTKSIRKNMKYLPRGKNTDIMRIHEILEETSKIVKSDSCDGKQNFDYFSGRFLGKHRVYGSTLITNGHIFYEVFEKYDKNEIDKYLNNIPENLKIIKEAIEQVFTGFEKVDFSLPNNTQKIRFTTFHLSRNIDDMVKASGFEKEIIYLLILVIQEINAVDFCLDCIFDEETIKENTLLLFFFTKWIATKLDEITDMFDAITKYGDKYNLSAKKFEQKLKVEVGNFDDLRETVRKLRNALHYENASKASWEIEGNINVNDIFDTLCPGYSSNYDYYCLYNKIRRRLNGIRVFCERNIGMNIIQRSL